MNVLYVGDNRDRPNWGCRGTSIALFQLLTKSFNISSKITGDHIARSVKVGEIFPSNMAYFFSKQDRISILNHFVVLEDKLGRKIGKSRDFIDLNLQRSVDNFIKYKNIRPQLNLIYQDIQSCDVMVINGEGDMIFTNPPRRKLLFLLTVMEIAKSLGKPVFYVNAMVSDCPISVRDEFTANQSIEVLKGCQLVALRDPVSFEIVRDFSKSINAHFIPDALFTWQHYFQDNILPNNGDSLIPHPEIDEYFGKLDFSKPFICIGGTSLAPKMSEKAIPAYICLVNTLKKLEKKLVLVQACTGDEFLKTVSQETGVPLVPINVPILMAGAVLSNARLFVSGRYHPSIFASLGGTPCIFLGSNSHKMTSLQDVLDYEEKFDFSAFPTEQECNQITELASYLIAEGSRKRTRIKDVVVKNANEASKITNLICKSLNSEAVVTSLCS